MRLTALNEQIYLLSAPTQYEVTSAFMRFQEFYESPFKEIRGHWFDHEEYMDKYAEENGNFTYTSDWAGFNIPGNIFGEAVSIFSGDAWRKEEELIELVANALGNYNPKKYYIIGCNEKDDPLSFCSHEIAHAMYYIYPKYKKEQKANLESLPPNIYSQIEINLGNRGYAKPLFPDEAQAYISTSTLKELKEDGFPKISKKDKDAFQDTFKRYLKETGLKEALDNWGKAIG